MTYEIGTDITPTLTEEENEAQKGRSVQGPTANQKI